MISNEKIYIFKWKKWHKLDPVPDFIVSEYMELLKFTKKENYPTPEMEYPYCNGTMLPIDLKN